MFVVGTIIGLAVGWSVPRPQVVDKVVTKAYDVAANYT